MWEAEEDFGEAKNTTEQEAAAMKSIIAKMKKKHARKARSSRAQQIAQNIRNRPVIGVPVAEAAPAEDSNSVPSIPIPMATTAIPIMRQPSTGYGGKSKRTRKRRRKRKTKRKKRKTKKRRRKRKRKTKKRR